MTFLTIVRPSSRATRTSNSMLALVILCVVISLRVLQPLKAQDDCVTCMPERNNAVLSGPYSVCIEPGTFSAVQSAAIEKGARHWLNHLHGNGTSITMTFAEDWTWQDHCDIKVYPTALGSPAEALVTSNGYGSEIRISEASLWRTDANYWEELLGHEWGHIVGFRNVDDRPGCVGYTLMTSGFSVPNLARIIHEPARSEEARSRRKPSEHGDMCR